MKPDRTNYETWLIDYLDRTLDEIQVKQLMSFLEENTDIKAEFADILTYNIEPPTGSFKHKNSLKKLVSDLSDKQFEYLCIAAAENDLSEQQRNELEAIIAENHEKKKTYELIFRLKLVAPSLKFNKKSALRKLTNAQKIVRLSVIGLSAAAGIALMISLFNMPFNKNDELKSLTSANLAGDSNIVKPNTINIATDLTPVEKKEVQNPDIKNALALLQKSVSEEMKVLPVKALNNDSSAANTLIRLANISKIGFIEDVKLVENDFTSTLIAINTNEIPSLNMPEKLGFNGFIAKTFREKILKSKTPETGSLKFYEIADAGINGLNKLLGWEMSLQKTRDEKGDLKSLYFSSKSLKFNAPVKKVQLEP